MGPRASLIGVVRSRDAGEVSEGTRGDQVTEEYQPFKCHLFTFLNDSVLGVGSVCFRRSGTARLVFEWVQRSRGGVYGFFMCREGWIWGGC